MCNCIMENLGQEEQVTDLQVVVFLFFSFSETYGTSLQVTNNLYF